MSLTGLLRPRGSKVYLMTPRPHPTPLCILRPQFSSEIGCNRILSENIFPINYLRAILSRTTKIFSDLSSHETYLEIFWPSNQVKVVSSVAQDLYKLEHYHNIQLYRARILSLDLRFNSIELSF
jgi:hypothetical protein